MKDHKKLNVFITGGMSSIGSLLTERLLEEGHEVVSFDIRQNEQISPQLTCIKGDIRDFEAVHEAAKGCNAGVHLAITAGEASPSDMMSVNVQGAYSFFKTAANRKFRMSVLASSAPSHLLANKKDNELLLRTAEGDVYDLTKKLQEVIAQDYHAHGLPVHCLRFGHVVRGKENANLRGDLSLENLDYCRGGWVALEDVVTGCLAAIKSSADPIFHPYNLVGSKSGRGRFHVNETEKRFGISLIYDFSEYE